MPDTLSNQTLCGIKILSLDVDGILTDGGIYYADDGNSYRKFNAKDGMGITQLMKTTGVVVTIISAGAPGAIEHRAKRLNIKHVYTDVHDKLAILQNLCGEMNIGMGQVAHMGDDINDLSIMAHVGLSITANDAIDEVLAVADIITKKNGGHGAVREVCDLIMQAHK